MVAFVPNGTIEVNVTVPVPVAGGSILPSDSLTEQYVRQLGSAGFTVGSTQLGSLRSGQTTEINIAIYHQATVTKWTVIPVWTDTP